MYTSTIVKLACSFHGQHKSRKNEDVSRQNKRAPSKKCNCPVYIILTSPKCICPAYHITSFELNHVGHDLDPTLHQYTKLTQDMLRSIEKCAVLNLGITQTMAALEHGHNDKDNPKFRFNQEQVRRHLKAFKNVLRNPNDIPESMQLLSTLLRQENGPTITDRTWYSDSLYDSKNRLVAVFWMSPIQRQLYKLYHDVIVNDTTMKTNRLGMRLNCTVIVDANFKTRLVANALIANETEKDYHWILDQLKKATEGLEPKVIMVDEDASMDAVLPEVFPNTHIVNCIWHIHENIRRHLAQPLGRRFEPFMKRFRQVTDSRTPAVFDRMWLQLLKDFNGQEGDNPEDENLYIGPVGHHLQRLYRRRHHWAGPWVQASFTASMRSTQRVEKSHHLIKMMNVHSKTSLQKLFDAICERVRKQELFEPLLTPRQDIHPLTGQMFRSILELNKQFLGSHAITEIQNEMSSSFGMRHSNIELNEVLKSLQGSRWDDKSNAVSEGRD